MPKRSRIAPIRILHDETRFPPIDRYLCQIAGFPKPQAFIDVTISNATGNFGDVLPFTQDRMCVGCTRPGRPRYEAPLEIVWIQRPNVSASTPQNEHFTEM